VVTAPPGTSQSHARRAPPRWCEPPPALLLVAVALHQIFLGAHRGAGSRSGGGFGCSTTDGWGARHLHAFALRPGLRRELELPRELIDPLRRTLALPTEPRLRALAETLASLPTPDQGPLEAIEIQVFARRYDPATLAPSGELLRGVVVRFDER
jgi:hypothetical protein